MTGDGRTNASGAQGGARSTKREVVIGPRDVLVPLTMGKHAIVDLKYGLWVMNWNWRFMPIPDDRVGYAIRTSNEYDDGPRRTIYLHRAIMDEPPGLEVDHINGNGLDCRRANLRVADHVQNSRNRGANMGRTWKGVTVRGARFSATIKHEGRTISLGSYATPQEAALAYDVRARELFGEFARLNYPDLQAPQESTPDGDEGREFSDPGFE